LSSVADASASATRCRKPGELGSTPHRSHSQHRNRGVGAVVEQSGQRTIRVSAENQTGAGIQLAFNVF